MTQKPILSIVDALRGEFAQINHAILLAAVLVTWQKLSQTHQISEDLALSDSLIASPRDAEKALAQIGSEQKMSVFQTASSLLGQASQRGASEALKKAMLMGQKGLLDVYDPSDLATILGDSRTDVYFLPPEVSDLLVALASGNVDSEIYLPWDNMGQLLGRVLRRGGHAAVEVLQSPASEFAEVVRAYCEPSRASRIQVSDPIKSPSYIDKGVPTRFPFTIATPPFGLKLSFEAQTADPFGRFPEKTNSMTVLAIRHVLAQTDGRAIVIVTNSVLFSAGGEKRLRKDLLDTGVLESVIALPAGLLPGTAIPVSILVFDTTKRHDHVRLVNCDLEKYKVAESRTRFKLTCLEEIAGLALGNIDGPDVRSVSRDEINENDLNLLPSRYVLDEVMSRVDRILAKFHTAPLEQVANILRPLPTNQDGEPIPALEVGAADIFDNGYISAPSKNVSVTGSFSKNDDQFLRPLDIVMVIKGSVGKVSIAPPNTPEPGPGGWVVGQSMAIVRTNESTDPRALVVFLRSDMGQELIRRLVAGAAIPFLQIRELRQLKVPVLKPDQAKHAASVLDEQDEVRQELARLQERLSAIQFDEWQMPKRLQAAENL